MLSDFSVSILYAQGRCILFMVRSPARVERFGVLELPLGGRHGYKGVRPARKGQWQGYTPKKGHTTRAYATKHEAAVARAQLMSNKKLGLSINTERVAGTSHSSRWAGELLTTLPSHISLCLHNSLSLRALHRATGVLACQGAAGGRTHLSGAAGHRAHAAA